MKEVFIFSAVVFVGYCLVVMGLYAHQERLLFPAQPLPQDFRYDFDIPYQELTIEVEGAELNALHFQRSDPKGVVFFLHGNAGNLETWATGLEFYERVNYDLFIFDYRGYGKSTGNIESEQQLFADVRTAWELIAAQYRDKKVVFYGRSLGSGLAIKLASDITPDLLVLVSAYKSILSVARQQYPWVPSWVLRYPLRSDLMIGDIQSETLLFHGAHDQVIPMADSRYLLSKLAGGKQLFVVPGAGHNDIHAYPEYLDNLAIALQEL